MGQDRRQPPAEEGPSAPLWMVTFSDCMNLLLTFFVLLVTFSSFDTDVLTNLGLTFRNALPGIFEQKETSLDKDDLSPTTQLSAVDTHKKGSEKPTLTKGPEDSLKEETQLTDFRSRKIFLVPSKTIFLGRGMVISPAGKNILATMASFLKEVPSRVVISETVADSQDDKQLGLQRAWAVTEYLTTKQGLDKGQFSITASTLQENLKGIEPANSGVKTERMLEVVLLERSIYN